jgi:hypothetical protein
MKLDTTIKNTMLTAEMQGMGQPNAAEKKGKDTAQEFEALLIRKVVEAMRKTIPEGGLGMSGGRQMHDYLVEESLTQALKEGGGMGMGRLFERNVAPQSPRTRGVIEPGGLGSLVPGLTEPSGPSLGDQLPPTEDAWLNGPNPEQELMRLMMGPGGGSTPSPTGIEGAVGALAEQLPPSRDPWSMDNEQAPDRLRSILSGEESP